MSFPSSHAVVYRNEVGEVLGWDEPSYDEPEFDDRAYEAAEADFEALCDYVYEFVSGADAETYTTEEIRSEVQGLINYQDARRNRDEASYSVVRLSQVRDALDYTAQDSDELLDNNDGTWTVIDG